MPVSGQELYYLWPHQSTQTIAERLPVPEGFARVPVRAGSFQDWLRHLPLKPGRPEVLLYSGEPRPNQEAHFAVIDMDVPKTDFQQCADSIIRLRAEYLYSVKDYRSIHFNFTSGHEARFDRYALGYRPVVAGNFVRWLKPASPDSSYQSFQNYLLCVFRYAGSFSLNKELVQVKKLDELRAGDIFIRGGFPGHAVMVVDVAAHPRTGEKIFLLAQGFIPAQDMHILLNPDDQGLSPWYPARFGDTLHTPQYSFQSSELKRFAKAESEKE